MNAFSQGDMIRIAGFRNQLFLIVSKNAFIQATGVFHVCPAMKKIPEGPLHIPVTGIEGTEGVVICEQVKMIDPEARACKKTDRISYGQIMNVSDALQGIFEYD